MELASYRDLKVWRTAMDLAEETCRVSVSFPKEETYGMTSQIRRASVSIAANIAEGYGRDNQRTFLHFLRISQGSLKELETHLLLAVRVGLANDTQVERSLGLCDEIGRMLRALMRSIRRRHLDD